MRRDELTFMWQGSSWTQKKARAGVKKPMVLNIFLRLVTLSPRAGEERAQSNSLPEEERSSMPRVGSVDSRPFCSKQ